MPELRDAMENSFAYGLHPQQALVMMLGSMRVEARLAAFLVDLAERFTLSGYSPRAFVLPMTRRDIAAYLAISYETVTRALMALKRDGLIALSGCRVEIRALQRLEHLRREAPESPRTTLQYPNNA